jgi:uncharacterized protein (TIGR02466 family)
MELHNLFPTPIGIEHTNLSLTPEENEFIMNSETVENLGNKTSKDNWILNDPKLKRIRHLINAHIASFVEDVYCPCFPLDVYTTQSWLNFSKKGDFHHPHFHRNSFVSGVLYLNVVDGEDEIKFHRHQAQEPMIVPQSRQYNLWTSETWFFKVKMGTVVVFPSWLMHSVPKIETDSMRISLSFNTFVNGMLGAEPTLTALPLAKGKVQTQTIADL